MMRWRADRPIAAGFASWLVAAAVAASLAVLGRSASDVTLDHARFFSVVHATGYRVLVMYGDKAKGGTRHIVLRKRGKDKPSDDDVQAVLEGSQAVTNALEHHKLSLADYKEGSRKDFQVPLRKLVIDCKPISDMMMRFLGETDAWKSVISVSKPHHQCWQQATQCGRIEDVDSGKGSTEEADATLRCTMNGGGNLPSEVNFWLHKEAIGTARTGDPNLRAVEWLRALALFFDSKVQTVADQKLQQLFAKYDGFESNTSSQLTVAWVKKDAGKWHVSGEQDKKRLVEKAGATPFDLSSVSGLQEAEGTPGWRRATDDKALFNAMKHVDAIVDLTARDDYKEFTIDQFENDLPDGLEDLNFLKGPLVIRADRIVRDKTTKDASGVDFDASRLGRPDLSMFGLAHALGGKGKHVRATYFRAVEKSAFTDFEYLEDRKCKYDVCSRSLRFWSVVLWVVVALMGLCVVFLIAQYIRQGPEPKRQVVTMITENEMAYIGNELNEYLPGQG